MSAQALETVLPPLPPLPVTAAAAPRSLSSAGVVAR
jgi:hypothetical protein